MLLGAEPWLLPRPIRLLLPAVALEPAAAGALTPVLPAQLLRRCLPPRLLLAAHIRQKRWLLAACARPASELEAEALDPIVLPRLAKGCCVDVL